MMNQTALTRRQMVALSAGALGAFACIGMGSRAFADEKTAATGTATTDASQAEAPLPGSVDADGFVLDMNGEPCIKAGTAKTILTVNSVATEMVIMLGGQEAAATLGQGFQYDEGSLNTKMYPGLTDLKTFTRDDCTVENVAAIAPDLVIIDVPDTITALRGADINAACMRVVSPETIMQAVMLLGNALGGDAATKAEAYCLAYQGAIDEIKAASADLADEDKPRVLYLRGIDRACGTNSMPDNWITACGGVNTAAELGLDGSGAEITLEAIMEADPAIVVCESPMAYADAMGSAALSELQAIKNDAVYTAPLGPVVWSMGSTEAMLQLYWAANTINPGVYSYDLDETIKEYFDLFYGYQISDDEIQEILVRA